MTAITDPGVECHESHPDDSGQWLLRVYDGHVLTRTVAWRQSPMDTYGPEHILLAVAAPVPVDERMPEAHR